MPSGGTGGDGGESSSDGPLDPNFQKPDDTGGSSGDDESGGSSSGTTSPVDAHFMGAHDGVYTGTVTIDFSPAGSCSGNVTITVDSTADPQIVGEGECTGMILDGIDGGSTDIDGILQFDAPSGAARQDLDGTLVEVAWDGAFHEFDFDGAFDGTADVSGLQLAFVGSWTVQRQ